jgi:hypothetical protein
MVCEGAKSARLTWVKNNGESEDVLITKPPFTYTLVQREPPFTGGQCPAVDYKVRIDVTGATTHPFYANQGCGKTNTWTSRPFTGTIVGVRETSTGSKQVQVGYIRYTAPEAGVTWDVFRLDNNLTNIPYAVSKCTRLTNPYGYMAGTLRNIRIIRADGEADDCGNIPSDCVLTVKNNLNEIIYEKTFSSECPSVNVECIDNKCPTGTCEVACGNIICCYGSDGIAIESFSL